jgi:hypothetical protein
MNALQNASQNEDGIKIHEHEPSVNFLDAYSRSKVTARFPLKVEYLALSHCWGGGIDSQLLKENVAAKMESIDVNELPKNFQHAISITHKLGFEYLWIDSLCILQNDEFDWKHQSAQMGLVYSNAICVYLRLGRPIPLEAASSQKTLWIKTSFYDITSGSHSWCHPGLEITDLRTSCSRKTSNRRVWPQEVGHFRKESWQSECCTSLTAACYSNVIRIKRPNTIKMEPLIQ